MMFTIPICVHEHIVTYFVSVDRFSSSAIVVGEVTSLTHELRNHSNFDIDANGQYETQLEDHTSGCLTCGTKIQHIQIPAPLYRAA